MSTRVSVSYSNKEQDKETLRHYLVEMMNLLHLEDGRVSRHNLFKCDAYLEIISSKVDIQEVPDKDEQRLIVRRAVLRLRRYIRHTLPLFRRALETEVRKYLERTSTFKVLMLMNVSTNVLSKFGSFEVLGTELVVPNWPELRELELGPLWQQVPLALPEYRDNEFWYLQFAPVLCEVSATSVREAVRKASQPFDTLRSLLNLIEKYGRVEYQNGGRPRPLAKILPSPVHGVFREDGTYQEPLYFTVERYDYRRHSLKAEQLQRALELAEQLWPIKSSRDLRLLLGDIVRKYGQALDTTDWQQGFLFLWQILETVASPTGAEIKMDKVISRIWLLLGQNRLARDLLRTACDTRNELVHLGKFSEEGLQKVNLLKVIVDRVISVLFARIDNFPQTKSLEAFYQFGPVNDVDLQEKSRVIDLILKSREGN